MDYSRLLSRKAQEMRPSGIRKFFDIAAEMEDCISLGVGEPDFKTPWAIREAGITSLERGRTRYTSNSGLKELRAEACRYLERRMDLHYTPDQVLITVGGSEASIPLKPENGFRLTAEELRAAITPRTKLLVLPFPCNPTGAVLRKEHLEELAEVLRDTDITVLSDEIYAELTYGYDRHVSIASIPGMAERTLLVNGFSKAYAMTGWRLGFACGPKPLIDIMVKIHQNCIMCAPTTSQYAAVVALRDCDEQIEEMRTQYDMRRRYLVKAFNEMGLHCFEPEGAFYVFPSIAVTGLSSEEFCQQLLYTQRVAVVPGTAFGDSGEGFVRVSYAYSVEHLQEAVRRIREFLKQKDLL